MHKPRGESTQGTGETGRGLPMDPRNLQKLQDRSATSSSGCLGDQDPKPCTEFLVEVGRRRAGPQCSLGGWPPTAIALPGQSQTAVVGGAGLSPMQIKDRNFHQSEGSSGVLPANGRARHASYLVPPEQGGAGRGGPEPP